MKNSKKKVDFFQYNSCITRKSFSNEFWQEIHEIFHKDLNFDLLPPSKGNSLKNWEEPAPFILLKYWECIWKSSENIGKEYLNEKNIEIIELRRIWEYIQIFGSIYHLSNRNVRGKKILSLGAGFEPLLYTFCKLGANVVASDIYNHPNFWHPKIVGYINTGPDKFCQYRDIKPNIKYIDLNLKNHAEICDLGHYDIIYSISSLEHIYKSFKRKKKLFKHIIEHLNEGGILSFSTELIVRYTRRKNYIKRFKNLIRSTSFLLWKFIKKLENNLNINKLKANENDGEKFGKEFLDYLKNLMEFIKNLPRLDRRYDFFTIEEILELIKFLRKKKMFLTDKVDWKSASEFTQKSRKYKGQEITQIALTFLKKE